MQNTALVSSHDREIGIKDALKGEYRGVSQVVVATLGSLDCDGDLRELLRVPMGIQEHCGVGRCLSGLHWVWCNGIGAHLELRREPQDSSPVVMWVSVCICFPLELSKGFQASRGVEFGTWGSFWISNRGIRSPFIS